MVVANFGLPDVMARHSPTPRRFPSPWSVDDYNSACFIVRDANGQQLAYIYFEDEPGRRSATKLLKLPELMHKID